MAAVTAAVVAAGATVYAANKSSKAAKDGAKATSQAASDSNALQWQMYDQSRQDNEPFRQNGLVAQNQYMRMLGLQPYSAPSAGMQGGYSYDPGAAYLQANPDVANDPYFSQNPLAHYQQYGINEGRAWNAAGPQASQGAAQPYDATAERNKAFDLFRSTPGYQFGLEEGVRGLDASASSSSGLYSGKAGKALARYMGNYADQQGYSPYMDRLASLSGMAQSTNNQNAASGQNLANAVSNNNQWAAANRASGLQQSAQAQGQMAQGLAQIGGWYMGQKKPGSWGWGGV